MFTLTFTQEQLRVLDQALQQMPYYMVAPVINSINEQIRTAREAADGN